MKKKLLSLPVTLILCLSLMPGIVHAQGEPEQLRKAILPGITALRDPVKTWEDESPQENYYFRTSDYVYFGKNSNDFLLWKVLDCDAANTGTGDAAFLLSDLVLMQDEFNSEDAGIIWQGSNAQSLLNQFSLDRKTFTETEYTAMLPVSKTDEAAYLFQDNWGASSLENEKLFLLSIAEVYQYLATYDYAPEMLAHPFGNNAHQGWWLRTPYDRTNTVGIINSNGRPWISSSNNNLYFRPAFNLDADSVLFCSNKSNGKSAACDGLHPVGNTSDNHWWLTLKDPDRSDFTAKLTGRNGDKVTVSFTNAKAGSGESISAIIADDTGAYTHYGKILDRSDYTEGPSGTVEIDLTGIDMTDKTLYVFNENCAAHKDNGSDKSSPLRKIYLKPPFSLTVKDGCALVSAEESCTLLLGSYDDSGRMLNMETYSIPAGTKEKAFPMDNTMKAFLLDENNTPYVPAVSLP